MTGLMHPTPSDFRAATSVAEFDALCEQANEHFA